MSDHEQPRLVLRRDGAREIDRAATERFGIPSILLMENAAAGLCRCVLDVLAAPDRDWVLIVCGPGNNGGDGVALARHLDGAGVDACLAMTVSADAYEGDAATNMRIAEKMGIPRVSAEGEGPSDALDRVVSERGKPGAIVDALFGTGLTRPIEGAMASAVRWINEAGAEGVPVVSIDIPSGLDADTGERLGETVRADMTVTMVAPKIGFDALAAQACLGEVRVVGIGTPRTLLESFGTPRAGGEHPGNRRGQEARDPGRRGRSV